MDSTDKDGKAQVAMTHAETLRQMAQRLGSQTRGPGGAAHVTELIRRNLREEKAACEAGARALEEKMGNTKPSPDAETPEQILRGIAQQWDDQYYAWMEVVVGAEERNACLAGAEALATVASQAHTIAELTAERDAYRRDFEAELAGNAALRVKHGARDDETMFAFLERLTAEAQAHTRPEPCLCCRDGCSDGCRCQPGSTPTDASSSSEIVNRLRAFETQLAAYQDTYETECALIGEAAALLVQRTEERDKAHADHQAAERGLLKISDMLDAADIHDESDEEEPRVAKALDLLRQRTEDLRLARGAIAAQDERERQAGERCGVSRDVAGCDWPEVMADQVQQRTEEVARLTRELAEEGQWLHEAEGEIARLRMALQEIVSTYEAYDGMTGQGHEDAIYLAKAALAETQGPMPKAEENR